MTTSNNDSLIKYMWFNRKYRLLIQSLVVLMFNILLFIVLNFLIARFSTQSTEHMDIIGNISDLTLEIATGAQHLVVVDSSDNMKSEEIIQTLQRQSDELDAYMAKLPNYPKQETAMDQFAVIWKDYRRRIALLSSEDVRGQKELAEFAYYNQGKIWDLMNIGYDTYLHDTYKTADYARYLTLGTFLSLIGYIIFFINYSMRQMRKDDELIDKAQSDMRDIMNTVKEGLFLINEDMEIGAHYSKKLEDLLGRTKIAGLTLPKLLENMVSEKDILATEHFVNYLYNSKVDEDLIQDINPLKQVEIIFLDQNGFTHHKFLHFDFLRVVNDDRKKSIRIFVSVVDVTESVLLKQRIQKGRADYLNFISRAVFLLSLDKALINEFLETKQAAVATINHTLNIRVEDKQQLVVKVKKLLVETEALIDSTNTLGLKVYDELVNSLIYELKCLTRLNDIQMKDFSNYISQLSKFDYILSLTHQLINKQTI